MDWGELGSLGKGYCYSFYCVLCMSPDSTRDLSQGLT